MGPVAVAAVSISSVGSGVYIGGNIFSCLKFTGNG